MSGFGIVPESAEHWKGMPEFDQKDLSPHQSILVHFQNPEGREALSKLIDRNLTPRTQSIWYPKEEIDRIANKRIVSEVACNPRYPVYIISKGRWETRLTSKILEKMGVPYRIVVEPQEYDDYAEVINEKKILTLPFSNLNQGSIPARNWVWEHSLEEGATRHWILDDNIREFFRFNSNSQYPVRCGSMFRAAEDFADRYENVALSGFEYYMFIPRKTKAEAFRLNTRIYSNILIKNDLPHRWRGRYNEDTDLSLRILKDGWCTILFQAFLAQKMPTMTMAGGNTEDLYKDDGRWRMSKSLEEQHPDVVTTTRKWGRWQHHVDYSRFKKNRLVLKEDAVVSEKVNNYGMYLVVDDEPSEILLDRLLMIGQAPGRKGDPSDPLGGKIGHRLAKLAGVEYERYVEATERMNLFDEWPGKDGKEDKWDAKAARSKAKKLESSLRGRRVLFVGGNVAKAFGEKPAWLEWEDSEELAAEIAAIPHPSGIVLWWNEAENREAAGEFLQDAFKMEGKVQ